MPLLFDQEVINGGELGLFSNYYVETQVITRNALQQIYRRHQFMAVWSGMTVDSVCLLTLTICAVTCPMMQNPSIVFLHYSRTQLPSFRR